MSLTVGNTSLRSSSPSTKRCPGACCASACSWTLAALVMGWGLWASSVRTLAGAPSPHAFVMRANACGACETDSYLHNTHTLCGVLQVFFDIALPIIIFNAGFSVKKKLFFQVCVRPSDLASAGRGKRHGSGRGFFRGVRAGNTWKLIAKTNRC